ncbi:MAG: NADH-quinone oxidoreductase subunit N, partial [Prevotella sp.]|nr:NADH-quinone oxidoreductase subunit N [Prevotella sp.]
MNYGQFLNMIPEAFLMAILVVVFIADFISAKKTESRKWFNPFVSLLLLAQVIVTICALE